MPQIEELRIKNLEKNEIKLQKIENKNAKKIQKKRDKELQQTKFANSYSVIKNESIKQAILKINEKYDNKILIVEEKIKLISSETTEQEKESLENSSLIKYYNLRIEWIKRAFEKKVNKVKYLESIAKLSTEKAEKEITKLSVDEGAAYTRWDRRIVFKKDNTSLQKLKNKIIKYNNLRKKEIDALEKRNEATLPKNNISKYKDIFETLKSKYIFGKQIRDINQKISSHVKKFSMFYILGIILAIFAITTKGLNLKSDAFMSVIHNNTYVLIIGLGMLLVIVAGYIDLSVGSMMGFIGAMSIIVFNAIGNMPLTIIIIVIMGACFGIVQGVLIGYFKLPSFIVTLGTMLLFQGLILTITKSLVLSPNADIYGKSKYIEFITGSMPDIKVGNFYIFAFILIIAMGLVSVMLMTLGRNKKAKYGLVTDSIMVFSLKIVFMIGMFGIVAFYIATSLFGLRYYLIYVLILVALFIFITQNTTFGRKIYAIGGNKKAAMLSGINASRVTMYIFTLNGAMVGFAAIVFTGIMTAASPLVPSQGYELDIISSVFLGGASNSGGIGTVSGTFIGGLILGYINNGMALMNLQADTRKVVKAVVLLAAVGYDIYSNRKSS